MAFHVACPITCQRICFCELGFRREIRSDKARNGFLQEISKIEEFLADSCSIRGKESDTVQVVVPKLVLPPPKSEAAVPVVDGFASGGDGYGAETEESLHSKRIALQKRAIAASIAAEEYARKFESGALAVSDNGGEAGREMVGEYQGVKVMCRICFDGENEGSEQANRMIPCKICNKKYHKSCLKVWGLHRDLFHLSSWVCASCRTCEVCRKTGDQTKFTFCKRCDGAYHCYCQPHLHKNVSNGPYLCPKHTRCHSCGSNVPGNGPSTRWFLGYTCCDACGRLFVKGNYCPVCLKVYRDSESIPMVCCDVCERWVHCECDGISDEKYLQFQADGNLLYKCTACRGECHQVTGIDDAVQELWRRRDKADRDLITSLRASAGLPTEEAFYVSFSDDEDYSPIVPKKEYGRSLKTPVKGSIHKGAKNNTETGKKMSSKKHGKKKENQLPLNGNTSSHRGYEGRYDKQSIEFTLSDENDDEEQLHRNERIDVSALPSTRSPRSTVEKCSINQAGIMKHDFIEEVGANNENRGPKVRSSKLQGPTLGFGFGKHANKLENVKGKKLVILMSARNKNVNDSPRHDAVSFHKEHDVVTTSNGSEDTSQQKVTKQYEVEKYDRAARFSDGKGEKFAKPEQLQYSRKSDSSLIKLGKGKSVVSDLKFPSAKGNITDGSTALAKAHVLLGRSKEGSADTAEHAARSPVLKAGEVPLRMHSKSTPNVQNEHLYSSKLKVSAVDSLPKDPKPSLKLKIKNPYLDSRSSLVPLEEEKSFIKGQRSKRKKPEKSEFKEEEEERNTQVLVDTSVNEAMDANWILKKLGKDAIGKRVEVHQPSDSSWQKGEVTDMVEGTSRLVVLLDGGEARTLDLAKQAIRFVSQKRKRSKTQIT